MPTAQLGGPSVSHPRGGRGTGLLLEFSLRGPSCDRDTALHWPALWSVGRRGGHCLPDPRASHVTWAPAPSLGKSPRVTGRLHSCLPWTLGLGWGGTGGGCCRPHCSPLSFRPQAPRLRDHRKAPAGCAALAWPGLAPSPLSPGRAWPLLPRTTGGQPGLAGQHMRGGRGDSLPHPRPLSVPRRRSSPTAPRPVSATAPPGRHPAHSMPPRASRAAVWCRALSPGAGSARPPLLSTHSRGVSLPIFECDFKEWKRILCVFIKNGA